MISRMFQSNGMQLTYGMKKINTIFTYKIFFYSICILLFCIIGTRLIGNLKKIRVPFIVKFSSSELFGNSLNETTQRDAKVQNKKINFEPLDLSTINQIDLLSKVAMEHNKVRQKQEKLEKDTIKLKVKEEEVEKKLKELLRIRVLVKNLLTKNDTYKVSKSNKLVKIIEGMKSKNAAQLFDRLETDTLRDIVPKIKPKIMSAIFDSMTIGKSKDLMTVLISEHNPFLRRTD